jgi:hypothetical protein
VSDNALFLLVLEQAGPQWVKKLRRIPLGELQKFAEVEPDREPRDAKAWAALFQRVLDKVRLPADADGKSATPEVLAQLADEFAAGYREHFKADPPTDVAGWERLTLELSHISVPGRARDSCWERPPASTFAASTGRSGAWGRTARVRAPGRTPPRNCPSLWR